MLFTVDNSGDVIPLDRNEADALLVGGARVLPTHGRRMAPVNVFLPAHFAIGAVDPARASLN